MQFRPSTKNNKKEWSYVSGCHSNADITIINCAAGNPEAPFTSTSYSHTRKIKAHEKLVVDGLVAQSCPTLATPWTVARQAPLSMGFSRQEYWSGLPFPSPGDLPDPGIKPRSPALPADSLPIELWGKPHMRNRRWKFISLVVISGAEKQRSYIK